MKEIRKCFVVSIEEIREKFDLPNGKINLIVSGEQDELKDIEIEIEIEEKNEKEGQEKIKC